MKKNYFSLFAAATMLFAVTSCTQEEDFVQSSGEMTTFSVSLDGAVGSRATGDGTTATKLYYQAYRGNELVINKSADINKTAKIEMALLKGETYDIIFWAQAANGTIYDIDDLRNITIDYATANPLANQESYDAFYNSLDNFTSDAKTHTIELRRPFAKLNLGTSDWDKVETDAAANVNETDPVTHTSVVVKGLANTLNTLTGEATGNEDVTFALSEIPTDSFTLNNVNYKRLSLNYLLVPNSKAPQGLKEYQVESEEGKANVDLTFALNRSNKQLFTIDVPNAPVQRNYRTNIVGELLTGTGFDVVIKPEEDKPSTDLVVIVEGLTHNLTTNVYYISSANGLSYASQNLFTQNGGSFVLTADVDMAGATLVYSKAANDLVWKMNKLTHTMANQYFEFDGGNYTIKNLPGMFIAYTGSAKSVIVKNLTLDTPNVAYNVEDTPDTDGVGAFIGYAGTTTTITLENCHVKGGKIEGGHWTGGLVGYAAGYSGNDGPVFETLTIKDCSVKNATITGKGSCGGIIGHATGDAWTSVDMDNIVVSSNAINSTGDSDNKAGSVMGTVGNAGQPKTVNGVTKTGGITIDEYEVSGNRVESNKKANTKLWGRQGNENGVLFLNGAKVEDFGTYTEPASEFTYENGIYTLQTVTASALTDILADASTNSYNDITIQLAEDQSLAWAAGPAGSGANKLSHTGKVTIKGGTLSVTGAGSFVVENELELEGVTVVDNTAYYSENGETAWKFCYLELTAKGTYKNCTFENTIMVDGQSAVFENCKFLGKSNNAANIDNEYAVWVYNGTAKFVNCEITGARGMKICDYYSGADVTSVEIDGCTFNDLYKKPGIAIDERQGNNMDVTVKNSTFNNVQPGDNGLYIYETDNVVPTIKNSKVIVNDVTILEFNNDGNRVVYVSNDTELSEAIVGAEKGKKTIISLKAGTYSQDINLTAAALDNKTGELVFKAAEGAVAVIAGNVTLGYRNQGVGAAMFDTDVTFEGITFDHAETGKHSITVMDVKSLTLKNCKIIGDGEYGIDSARGNATGTSKIEGCTFENAGMQLLGNFATGLVIDNCTFNESRINVQAGNGVTVQNCKFNNTLKSANVGDSFYCVRSNSTPITVKDCEIKIDSELTEVATSQTKWYLLANRGTTNWTVENVAVTLTDAALMQTELKVTACTSTGTINTTNLTVNGQ